jgi:agmatine/peptidylarginine deiminase
MKEKDERARELFTAFPDRTVMLFKMLRIILVGRIHCISQQMPSL